LDILAYCKSIEKGLLSNSSGTLPQNRTSDCPCGVARHSRHSCGGGFAERTLLAMGVSLAILIGIPIPANARQQ